MNDDVGKVTEDLVNLMRLVRFGIPYREAERFTPARRRECCRAIDRLDASPEAPARPAAEEQEEVRKQLERFVERARQAMQERERLIADAEALMDEARRSGFDLRHLERLGISADRLRAYKEATDPSKPMWSGGGGPLEP